MHVRYTCMCACPCAYMYMYVCVPEYVHACMYMYMYVHLRACVYMCVGACVWVGVRVRVVRACASLNFGHNRRTVCGHRPRAIHNYCNNNSRRVSLRSRFLTA